MSDFLKFLGGIGEELLELFTYAQRGRPDPAEEHRIAMALIRKSVDYQAKKEIQGDESDT